MKRNKLIFIIVLLVSLSSIVGPASANEPNNIKVSVDSKLIESDVPPKIINGRTLVPLRGIVEAFGIEPIWNGETRTVTVNNGNITIDLPIGSKNVTVNNEQMKLDVPATIVDGRTLVPTRFIAESFGSLVDWDNETKTIKISNTLESPKKEGEEGRDEGLYESREGKEGNREGSNERHSEESKEGSDRGREGSNERHSEEGRD